MKPIINETSSVLGFAQWQEFTFQPTALNAPTSWTASTLPPGVTIDGVTGAISGAAELPGVYVVAVRAHNADGASNPVIFTFGIEATSGDPTANAVDLRFDLGTRLVTGYTGQTGVLFSAKYRDGVLFRIQFERSGAPCVALTLTDLKIRLKQIEDDEVLCESADADYGDESPGVFLVYLALTGDDLAEALLDYEGPEKTAFDGLFEIEYIADNPLTVGPASIRGSSQTFKGEIVRDLGELTP